MASAARFRIPRALSAGFLKKVLNDATLFLMQSEEDAARLIALGAPGERVLVTGNLKYDLAEPHESPLSAWLEAELAKSNRRPVVVAGSVMANEEVPVLRAFAEVEREFPRALLILAPRKPEQFDNAAAIVAESGRKLLRRRDVTLNGAGRPRFRNRAMYFCSTVSANLPDSIALPTPCLWAARSFPAAGTIFSSRPRSAKFRSTVHRWKISAKWSAKFLAAGAAIQVRSSEELGAAWSGFASGTRACRAHGGLRAGIGGPKSRRDAACPGAHRACGSLQTGAEGEALLGMASSAVAVVALSIL